MVLLGWTLLGGLHLLNQTLVDGVAPRFGGMVYQMSLLLAFTLIGALLDLPWELYNTFVLEQRFGFNRITWKMYVADALKGTLVGALIGLPIAALILWLMGAAGAYWVALGLGRLGGLQCTDFGALPHGDCATIQ